MQSSRVRVEDNGDSADPRAPCTGILLGPSKSGKTVALISAILEQYRTADGSSVFERIYIFSPSIEIDDGWRPVKENTERELVFELIAEVLFRGRLGAKRPASLEIKSLQFSRAYVALLLIHT